MCCVSRTAVSLTLSKFVTSPEDCELPVKSPPAGVWVLTERVDLRRSASGARWPSGVAWYVWNCNTGTGYKLLQQHKRSVHLQNVLHTFKICTDGFKDLKLWAPCHHSMVMSSGCGWRDGLQLQRVAANTLNKQPRQPQLWVGCRLTAPHGKNKHVTNHSHEPWTWTDSLDKRSKQPNTDIRFITWNTTSYYNNTGSLLTVSK
jgi:hypothetical protein